MRPADLRTASPDLTDGLTDSFGCIHIIYMYTQMVGFHYFQNTPWPLFNRANAWGNAPFTFILMLSGACVG